MKNGKKDANFLIIIPAYKEADNIKSLVESIIVQYPQYDYIIVNDGSKDATRQICQKTAIILLIYQLILELAGQYRQDINMRREKGIRSLCR